MYCYNKDGLCDAERCTCNEVPEYSLLIDLAIELYNKAGLTPEELPTNGKVFIYEKDKGITETSKFFPLVGKTTYDIYQLELER